MKKLVLGIVVVAVVVLGGYLLFADSEDTGTPVEATPTPTPEVVVKYVTNTVTEYVDRIEYVVASDSAELISLREDVVDGVVEKLENRIERFEDRMEPIQDEIDDLEADIAVLQAKVDAKESIIDALDEIDDAAQIANLRAKIVAHKVDIEALEEQIEDLEEDLEPWQEKIDLHLDAIAEVDNFVATGDDDYSDDVEDLLEALGFDL